MIINGNANLKTNWKEVARQKDESVKTMVFEEKHQHFFI